MCKDVRKQMSEWGKPWSKWCNRSWKSLQLMMLVMTVMLSLVLPDLEQSLRIGNHVVHGLLQLRIQDLLEMPVSYTNQKKTFAKRCLKKQEFMMINWTKLYHFSSSKSAKNIFVLLVMMVLEGHEGNRIVNEFLEVVFRNLVKFCNRKIKNSSNDGENKLILYEMWCKSDVPCRGQNPSRRNWLNRRSNLERCH